MVVYMAKMCTLALFFLFFFLKFFTYKRKRLELILTNSKRKHALNIGSGILTLTIDKLPKKMLKQNENSRTIF